MPHGEYIGEISCKARLVAQEARAEWSDCLWGKERLRIGELRGKGAGHATIPYYLQKQNV